MLRSLSLSLAFAFCCSALFAQTPICTIQGSGTASTYDGQSVSTTGIVTAIITGTGTVQGFFIEEPACDANNATSNGLFVYYPNVTGIAVGQRVNVTGTVQEFQNLTELYSVTALTVVGSGSVTPTNITLPIASLATWERYEGMLLRFAQPMEVIDNDEWAHFGELLMAPSRLWQPTHDHDPNDADPNGTTSTGSGNVAAINAAANMNARSSIILDDGRTSTYPDPPPLMGPDGTVRCGSSVAQLTGVLHYAYSQYRLHPVGIVPLVHAPRPTVPGVGGDLRIAAYNVHNYWSTLGGFGAANSGELLRQRTKLTAALFAMNADALVLCELEDNDVAWADLLNALNALYGSQVYAAVERDEGFGTKSVIFYKTAVLTATTTLYWLYTSTFERAHITQGFQVNATGDRFLLSSMHPHSKLCDNATGDDLDQGDGQGCYNAHRRDQAQELAAHWAGVRATTGIQAQLIMGDFNAYTQEDPLDLMRANGLTYLQPADDADNYSFRYGTYIGALDHAFATDAMAAAVTGVSPWAINADEPPVLDYPDWNSDFYQPNAFRSSDHDPVLVGINTDLIMGLAGVHADQRDIRFTFDAATGNAEWTGAGITRIEVLDALGRTVLTRTFNNQPINVSGLPAGTYAWRCSLVGVDHPVVGRFVK